jgi:hypothetical protein
VAESPADDLARPMAEGRLRPTMTSRRWVRWASLIGVSYLALLGIMMAIEDSLIFFPSVYPEGFWKPEEFKFEDAWFTASDGTSLHGWYVPHPQPRAVILFAHGNAGRRKQAYWPMPARRGRGFPSGPESASRRLC